MEISKDFLLKGDEKESCPNSANFISILGNEVNIEPIKENMIVHYSFKEKNGIRVIKIDEETNQISLVPLNLEKHKIITIPSKELHLLKTAKIIRLIRDL